MFPIHSSRPLRERQTNDASYSAHRRPRILLIEDDDLVFEVLADMLVELDYDLVGRAETLDEAIEAAATLDFEFAIVDAVLKGGRSAEPVGSILRARGIPFVLSSGYQEELFGDELRGVQLLPKPYGFKELTRVLAIVA